jgi:hypothetical protein
LRKSLFIREDIVDWTNSKIRFTITEMQVDTDLKPQNIGKIRLKT